MKLATEFLQKVQDAGWIVLGIRNDKANAACGNPNCGVRASIKPDRAIPQCASPDASTAGDMSIGTYAELRAILEQRMDSVDPGGRILRDALQFPKPQSRTPSCQSSVELATALGFEVYLRSATVPRLTLRYIADGQDRTESRIKRNRHERNRRSARAVENQTGMASLREAPSGTSTTQKVRSPT